ncbi:MFS transporter [Alkalibaculum sporogenes]|nr:MFS transporter [Alkalibaculum sporogenes]
MDKKKIKIAIFAFSSVLMASMTASAILADISVHFPEVDKSIIQMVLTIPALLGMIFALVSGPLSTKISKKTLVLSALYCSFIGGSIAFFMGTISIYILLFSSVLIGIGQGINATMSMALIADYFKDDECSSLMGLQSAFVNGGSMVILLLAGILAGINWNFSYAVYLLYIPVIFIVVKNLSNDPPIHPIEDNHIPKGKLNLSVYFMCFIFFCFSTLIYVLPTNISLFISNNGLGDATSSGLANSLMSGVGALTGFGYGYLKRVLKNFVIPSAFIVGALGMLPLFIIGNLPSVFFATACAGFGLSLMFPSIMFIVSSSVAPSMSATAIAMAGASSSFGMFVSPLIINSLANQFGNGGEIIKFLIAIIGLFALSVIVLIGTHIIAKDKLRLIE